MANRQGSFRQYKAEYPDRMTKLMQQGALDCQIAADLKISNSTFYRWLDEIPDFRDAYDLGQPACEAWWIERGLEGMQGKLKKFNCTAWIAFMNNKFKWIKANTPDTTQTININQMNVLTDKSREGLIKYLTKAVESNQDIVDVKLIEDNNS